ncbi:MAG: glucose-6-phosphate isomerase [Syntrophaceae bacterium]|nr:glucose-6-phosphate isomerase [Syntrophaceae bacterium]
MIAADLDFFLGTYESAVLDALKSLQKDRIIQRIWDRDYTVWKSKPDGIVNRLGWLQAPSETMEKLSDIRSVVVPMIAEGYKDVVLLGMGGSSLAAEVFAQMLGSRKGHPKLHILDTTDPLTIFRLAHQLDWAKTIFLVSSKSGTTLETVSLFHYFYNSALKKTGKQACRNFIFITDPESPMEELAHRLSLRHVFLSNPAVGGRYSALAFPGIVPAALLGIDIEGILSNARAVAENEKAKCFDGKLNSSGTVLGTALGALAIRGRNKLTFIFPPSWMPFGGWLEQLLAESTGKEGKGILPVCAEKLNAPASYNDDRLFVIFHNKEKIESPQVSAIIDAGHPVITIRVKRRLQLGGQMFLWEMATAVAGHIMEINPFDQPNVEASKVLTRRMIDLYRRNKELPQEKADLTTEECDVYGFPSAAAPADALAGFLAAAKDDAYVCLQIYLTSEPEVDAALRKLQESIRRKYKVAVVAGYGPRYLHSTGQLHKGDAGNGLFIQLTSNNVQDIEIPDYPGASGSTLTFGAIKAAQAMGDRQALIKLGRKVIRFHLKGNIIANIKSLALNLAGRQ